MFVIGRFFALVFHTQLSRPMRLFVSQSFWRIDASGAAGWNIWGQKSYSDDPDGGHAEWRCGLYWDALNQRRGEGTENPRIAFVFRMPTAKIRKETNGLRRFCQSFNSWRGRPFLAPNLERSARRTEQAASEELEADCENFAEALLGVTLYKIARFIAVIRSAFAAEETVSSNNCCIIRSRTAIHSGPD